MNLKQKKNRLAIGLALGVLATSGMSYAAQQPVKETDSRASGIITTCGKIQLDHTTLSELKAACHFNTFGIDKRTKEHGYITVDNDVRRVHHYIVPDKTRIQFLIAQVNHDNIVNKVIMLKVPRIF